MARRSALRSFLFVPATILACSLATGLILNRVEGVNAATTDSELDKSHKLFTQVLALVEDNYADPVTPDKTIFKGAIPGMLRTLDPHSSFFDPKDYEQMREDQRGRYYGVGMQITQRGSQVVVMHPFPGSPAYKAGLRPGDLILEVNDKKTDGMTTADVANILRGPRGTKAQIVIAREGIEKPITYNVVRDEIPRKSVQDAHWVKPGIMYLDIESFNENTSREVEDNFKRMGEKNVKGLILDLRDNPGGLLTEGVAVADRFLQKGQKVVSHRGRASAEKRYVAQHGNSGFDYPVVVLTNRSSASAAEIVSGALQDHDRGWILGDNTFGKGLVQTVYPLAENTGLALTTAKYYTPSDRLIQRDYQNTSFFDYYYRKNTEARNPLDVKMTDSGRTVYGGGGIAPDEKYVGERLNKFQVEFLRKFAFSSYTAKYFGDKEARLPAGWTPDDKIVNEFHAYVVKEKLDFTEADWAANHEWIKQRLHYEFAVTAFGVDEARKIAIGYDPHVLKGIDALPKAKQLTESAKKMIVQRMR
jgi:carboxyl-terminal processing protease